MKITLKILVLCFLLFSCKETTKELNKKTDKKQVLTGQQENLVSTKEEIASNSKNDVTIKFPNLILSLKDIDMSWEDEYNKNDNIYETKQDTAFFYLNPGDWMFKKSFKIEEAAFDEIEMYGQFEIKVAIATKREIEVPVCILEDWKGYTSKWTKLKIDKKDLKFPIMDETTDQPINFTIDELKNAVEKHCGPEWLDEIRNIKAVDKLPASFFTTRFIYKIIAKNSKTNDVIEKYLVFYTPTSC
ncbi:hypothetical protein [Flavobacterium sp. FlaQc-48]|uniref:hypothetical protein n=1 Tax=Flavobacterium sp. FlaQc-48 TaxID=3374181 RepID=UPI003757E8A4